MQAFKVETFKLTYLFLYLTRLGFVPICFCKWEKDSFAVLFLY